LVNVDGHDKKTRVYFDLAALFFFVPPGILGFVSGLLKLSDMAMWFMLASVVSGSLGLILSLRGKLPGTGRG
jgi:hypothetical protein